ncbi:ABC transporter ATP-binding protein [Hyphococcus luteus]|uniref:Sugar ABC transporter ATP-binding protein n=1 Tax=Hyphococcus luteus TaxID=2058213 RepID=A0A2S7K7S1_9PROT|nr:ABC transporter ATP-binding protein [Marinicaulis flavus]PQA88555.1 sugar ABC transporter ATP-binding protein [Marinicaulis flavus]
MARILLENVTVAYPLLGRTPGGTPANTRKPGSNVVTQKGRSSVVAFSDLSLDLRDGDRLGLVGRNGSGKSTLLRVMAGVYEPSLGRVSVSGNIASLFNVGIGMQREATGRRNIELMGLAAGRSLREIRAKADEIADFAELGPFIDLPVRTYSSGMAMRLKFACGTAFTPEILLMDEWLGAGDTEFRRKARERMRELVDQAGILVLATHNHKLIQSECNKVLWLNRGRVRALGPPEEVLAKLERREPKLID